VIHAHLEGKDTKSLIRPERLLAMIENWRMHLNETQDYVDKEFEGHEKTGRPLIRNCTKLGSNLDFTY